MLIWSYYIVLFLNRVLSKINDDDDDDDDDDDSESVGCSLQ